jgi:hypothetical protein
MSAQELEAAKHVLESSEVMARAIHDENPENLEAAIELRVRCFQQLQEVISTDPSEEILELFSQTTTIDRKTLGAAQEMQEEIRGELEFLSTARRAAKAFQPAPEPPRFITKRV